MLLEFEKKLEFFIVVSIKHIGRYVINFSKQFFDNRYITILGILYQALLKIILLKEITHQLLSNLIFHHLES